MIRHSVNVNRIITILSKENKSNDDVEYVNKYLSQYEDYNKIIAKISKLEKSQLLKAMNCKIYSAGEVIFLKGDPVQHFYLVLKGIVENMTVEKQGKVITTCPAGKQIVDKSSMRSSYRNSTCISFTDSALIVIPMDIYREILGEDAHMLLHKKIKFIDQYFPGIKKYSFSHRERIGHLIEVFILKKGSIILNQGEETENFYFLCDGEVHLDGENSKIPILKLTPGSCIGEEILVGLEAKYTSIVSSDQAVLYALKKNDLIQYVPEETRETWKRNYLLKEQERRRLNSNVGVRLRILQQKNKGFEYHMASPNAKKQLSFVKMRYLLASSERDFRESHGFQDSKRLLVKLRSVARIKRPDTMMGVR